MKIKTADQSDVILKKSTISDDMREIFYRQSEPRAL